MQCAVYLSCFICSKRSLHLCMATDKGESMSMSMNWNVGVGNIIIFIVITVYMHAREFIGTLLYKHELSIVSQRLVKCMQVGPAYTVET